MSLPHRAHKQEALELLNKTDDTGVSFKGGVSPCEVCAMGKSTRQAHPQTATLNIGQPFEVIHTDRLGPITPTTLGGFRYVSKFIDENTKWKETLLFKSKAEGAEPLRLFAQQGVVAPLGYRIERCRADRGGEYTGE